MGKKVLGLIASYRKLGNSEIVTKAISRQMGDDWELSLIRLPELDIAPCRLRLSHTGQEMPDQGRRGLAYGGNKKS